MELDLERKTELKNTLFDIRRKTEEAQKNSPYGQTTRILLATKTRSPEEINYAKSLGFSLIGENRVQELLEKYDRLDKNGMEIHFIGALQTNKVKAVIDKVDMIESVDRLSLALEIEKQAAKIGKVMDVLVEINIGREETKSGIFPEDAEEFLRKIANFSHLRVCGLMAIPPKMTDFKKQMQYFQNIMELSIDISSKKIDNIGMAVLSIGMSSDYELATSCGSTQVRIGTAAFGQRNYQ